MKTLLVPIDFSETSKNAAIYAVALAKGIDQSKLVFFHVFNRVSAGADGTPLKNNLDARKQIIDVALRNLVHEIAPLMDVKIVAEEGDSLTESLVKYVKYHGADLVVMGLTGASRIEQLLMGSNALNMAHEAICPVLIVPAQAKYKGINNILFATDMNNVKQNTPIKPLLNLLECFKADLHVVNVNSEIHVELTDEYKAEKADLEEMLQGYNPSFYFIRIGDFVDAINTFAGDFKIDLILTIPRKHNFMASLFNPSQTKRLLYHTHIPLVAIHD